MSKLLRGIAAGYGAKELGGRLPQHNPDLEASVLYRWPWN